MKKVLITGNRGYIGSLLCKKLKKENFFVNGVDTNWFTKKNKYPEFVDHQINCDISKLSILDLKDVDYIVHLAAISNDPMSEEFKNETYKLNFSHSKLLYKLAKKAKIKKFIFASSCSLYGLADKKLKNENSACKPLTNYSKSKFLFEKYLLTQNDKVSKVILRFGTAAGISPNFRLDLAINNLIFFGLKNKIIKVLSNGKPHRPFIDTEDMCKSIIFFLKEKLKKNANVYNIGINSNNIQIVKLAKIISKKLNIPYKINELADDDERSYKVNFSKIKKKSPKLVKNFKSIDKIVEEVSEFIKSKNFKFKNSYFRLKYLKKIYKRKNRKLI